MEETKLASMKGSPSRVRGVEDWEHVRAAGFNWTSTLPIQNPIHLLEGKMQEPCRWGRQMRSSLEAQAQRDGSWSPQSMLWRSCGKTPDPEDPPFLQVNTLEKANSVSGGDLLPWGRGWGDK